jgi:hypothetical protein
VTVSEDKTARIWDADSGAQHRQERSNCPQSLPAPRTTVV